MIAHRTSTFNGLVQEMNRLATAYCARHRLPKILVIPDDGSMEPEFRAAFNWKKNKIMVSLRLLAYLQKYPNKIKVWGLFSAIRHELKHYEQYLFLRSKYKRITRGMFDENEAMTTGRLCADNQLRILTPVQINPILETIGSAAVTGFGIGLGFKGVNYIAKKVSRKK